MTGALVTQNNVTTGVLTILVYNGLRSPKPREYSFINLPHTKQQDSRYRENKRLQFMMDQQKRKMKELFFTIEKINRTTIRNGTETHKEEINKYYVYDVYDLFRDIKAVLKTMPKRYQLRYQIKKTSFDDYFLIEIPHHIISFARQKDTICVNKNMIKYLESIDTQTGEDFDTFIDRWTKEKIKEVYGEAEAMKNG